MCAVQQATHFTPAASCTAGVRTQRAPAAPKLPLWRPRWPERGARVATTVSSRKGGEAPGLSLGAVQAEARMHLRWAPPIRHSPISSHTHHHHHHHPYLHMCVQQPRVGQ